MTSASPQPLALVLCEQSHADPISHRFTLTSTFHALCVPGFPCAVRFTAYYAITGIHGAAQIVVRLVDGEESLAGATPPLFEDRFNIDQTDPLSTIEGAIQVRARIPHEGLYRCDLSADGEPLVSRRLWVRPGALH